MKRINTLVFPAGTEVGLEIRRSLEHSVHVKLHGASSRDDYSALAFERLAQIPAIHDRDFDQQFSDLLESWQIQVVFATHDSVHLYLAERARQWGIFLVNGDAGSALIARSKRLTYDTFKNMPWMPICYRSAEDVENWPVVVKPSAGQGGQGVVVVADATALRSAMERTEQPVICEYLPGEELTVDCFSLLQGEMLYVAARTRERIVGGITMRSQIVEPGPDVRKIAESINSRLRMRGPWFFQLKSDRNDDWKLLEVSCRLSTGAAAHRAAGVNLPLLAIQDYLERQLQVLRDVRVRVLERCLHNGVELDYAFSVCYMDLDDTLVHGGVANPQAMHFIYRLLGRGKSIVLLTRHAHDVLNTLNAACISPAIFSAVIHLRKGEKKSAYIRPPAIFVDNHFPERLEVSRAHGIPVFDVDAMDLLFH